MSDHFVIPKMLILLVLLQLLSDVPLSLSTAMMIYDTPAGPETETVTSFSGSSASSTGDRTLQQESKVGYHTRHVAVSTLSNPGSRVEAEGVKEQHRHLQVDFASPIPSSQSTLQLQTASQVCMYRVEVRTGSQWGAGTDSTISMRLTGFTSSSSSYSRSNYTEEKEEKPQQQELYFELPDTDNGSNSFEYGSVDVFQVKSGCLTNICKLTLYSDHSGWFADWFVESVTVSLTNGAPAEEHMWTLNQWLPTSSGSLNVVKDACS
ncbi:hypothetical protein R1sor_005285 [Riccia sorocarpa]|uniref:PLAT domain-containing protein n=1 Tax=Riccia sorocarpa TaxID=122646 RepID=A0ABD3HMN1_9MARC